MARETAWFRGEGGSIFQMDLPLPELMAAKVAKGYLVRVNPDGSPYTEPPASNEPGPAPARRPRRTTRRGDGQEPQP